MPITLAQVSNHREQMQIASRRRAFEERVALVETVTALALVLIASTPFLHFQARFTPSFEPKFRDDRCIQITVCS